MVDVGATEGHSLRSNSTENGSWIHIRESSRAGKVGDDEEKESGNVWQGWQEERLDGTWKKGEERFMMMTKQGEGIRARTLTDSHQGDSGPGGVEEVSMKGAER